MSLLYPTLGHVPSKLRTHTLNEFNTSFELEVLKTSLGVQ